MEVERRCPPHLYNHIPVAMNATGFLSDDWCCLEFWRSGYLQDLSYCLRGHVLETRAPQCYESRLLRLASLAECSYRREGPRLISRVQSLDAHE